MKFKINIRRLAILLFSVLVSLNTYSSGNLKHSNSISGAFGMKFSDTLSDYEMSKCSKSNYCFISPNTPYIVFSRYSVRLTPLKGKIFEINGSGKVSSSGECILQAEKILRALKRKYNLELKKTEYSEASESLMTLWIAHTGKQSLMLGDQRKSIYLKCADRSKMNLKRSTFEKEFLLIHDHAISITYRDNGAKAMERLLGMMNEKGL